MSDEEMAPPEKEEGGGAPLWMATFADLMSLLLAFFVLLFSFASMDDKLFAEIGGSFQDAFGMEQRINQLDRMGMTHIQGTFTGGKPGMSFVILSLSRALEQWKRRVKVNKSNEGGQHTRPTLDELVEMASFLLLATKEEMLQRLLADDSDIDNMHVEYGPRTFTVRLEEEALFEPGGTRLRKNIDSALRKVARLAESVNGTISVFGHADSEPFETAGVRSLWELSVMRAVTVTNRLSLATEFPRERLEAIGRGTSHPIYSSDFPEGQRKNRRVEFLIEHPELAKQIIQELPKEEEPETSIFQLPEYLMRVPSKIADPANEIDMFQVRLD